jgi:hypothetical protein
MAMCSGPDDEDRRYGSATASALAKKPTTSASVT